MPKYTTTSENLPHTHAEEVLTHQEVTERIGQLEQQFPYAALVGEVQANHANNPLTALGSSELSKQEMYELARRHQIGLVANSIIEAEEFGTPLTPDEIGMIRERTEAKINQSGALTLERAYAEQDYRELVWNELVSSHIVLSDNTKKQLELQAIRELAADGSLTQLLAEGPPAEDPTPTPEATEAPAPSSSEPTERRTNPDQDPDTRLWEAHQGLDLSPVLMAAYSQLESGPERDAIEKEAREVATAVLKDRAARHLSEYIARQASRDAAALDDDTKLALREAVEQRFYDAQPELLRQLGDQYMAEFKTSFAKEYTVALKQHTTPLADESRPSKKGLFGREQRRWEKERTQEIRALVTSLVDERRACFDKYNDYYAYKGVPVDNPREVPSEDELLRYDIERHHAYEELFGDILPEGWKTTEDMGKQLADAWTNNTPIPRQYMYALLLNGDFMNYVLEFDTMRTKPRSPRKVPWFGRNYLDYKRTTVQEQFNDTVGDNTVRYQGRHLSPNMLKLARFMELSKTLYLPQRNRRTTKEMPYDFGGKKVKLDDVIDQATKTIAHYKYGIGKLDPEETMTYEDYKQN